jgi:hypothetical protein
VPRLGQRDRPDLAVPGRAQPERVRVVEHVLCLGFVRHLSRAAAVEVVQAIRVRVKIGSAARCRRRR